MKFKTLTFDSALRYLACLTLDLTVEYVLALEQDSYDFLRGSHSECLFQPSNDMY